MATINDILILREPSYAKLGIKFSLREQLALNANQTLKIMCDQPIVPECIDISVVQLAVSDYIATSPRQPSLQAAAKGGAFLPATTLFITEFLASEESLPEIYNSLALATEILQMSFAEYSKNMLYPILREIVSVSEICRTLPRTDFDQHYGMIRQFKGVGFTATEAHTLATVSVESPEVYAALGKLLLARRIKDGCPTSQL